MPRRCRVGGCSTEAGVDKIPLHVWPASGHVAAAWMRFLKSTRSDTFTLSPKSAHICSLHFTSDSFVDLQQYRQKVISFLRLQPHAVPTIRQRADSPLADLFEVVVPAADTEVKSLKRPSDEPTTAILKRNAHQLIREHIQRVKNVETQTTIATCSQGTQTAAKTASKGIQASFSPPEAVEVELVESDVSHSSPDDPDYKPKWSKQQNKSMATETINEIILVTKARLLQLLAVCCVCANVATVTEETSKLQSAGSLFTASISCSTCGHKRRWQNQPIHGQMPLVNLLMSAALYFSGGAISQSLRLLKFMKVRTIALCTVMRHIRQYLNPHILISWKRSQNDLLDSLAEKVVVQGDCRSDSPGHSALFGTYSLLESTTGKIMESQLVQSNEVTSSYNCEKEGLTRCLAHIGQRVGTIVTDRHPQIAKFLREDHPDIKHRFDVWHMAKGLGKQIEAAGKLKGCELLLEWKKSIINHFYWCVKTTSDSDGDLVIAKWRSILYHVTNKHKDFPTANYKSCSHGPIEKRKKWLKPDSKAFIKLEEIVEKKRLIKDMPMLSRTVQTSALESFHSMLLMFVPKKTAFSYIGMKARTALAILHWNHNSGREVVKMKVEYSKAKKGEPSVKKVKTPTDYGYATNLVESLIETVFSAGGAEELRTFSSQLESPAPYCDKFDKKNKQDIITAYVSRFKQD